MDRDRAYINFEKFEELSERDLGYVTKLKKNPVYETKVDLMFQNEQRQMQYREQIMEFRIYLQYVLTRKISLKKINIATDFVAWVRPLKTAPFCLIDWKVTS